MLWVLTMPYVFSVAGESGRTDGVAKRHGMQQEAPACGTRRFWVTRPWFEYMQGARGCWERGGHIQDGHLLGLAGGRTMTTLVSDSSEASRALELTQGALRYLNRSCRRRLGRYCQIKRGKGATRLDTGDLVWSLCALARARAAKSRTFGLDQHGHDRVGCVCVCV
jgi:hypothetical protein